AAWRSRPEASAACMSAPIPLRGTMPSGGFPNGWRARLFGAPGRSISSKTREECVVATVMAGGVTRDGAAIQERALRGVGGLSALGIGEGDVVAVMLRNEPAFLEAMLIARLAGCYSCPINFHYKADEAG